MRRIPITLALAALVFCANRSSPDDRKTQGDPAKSTVVKEQVRGGVAFPTEKRQWTRITGTVKVLTAHTLLFEDGTETGQAGRRV